MYNRGRITTTAALAVVAMMALASPIGQAFACTASAYMSVSPNQGQAGSTTTVTGERFTATAVEIRWNSRTGPLLATAQGPSFETSVRIPADTQAGVYYIVATGADGKASGTYEVLPATTTTTSTRPPSSTTTQPPSQSPTTTTAPSSASASGDASVSAGGSTSTPAPQASSPDAGPAPVGASGQAAASASASASAPTAARITTTTATPPGGTLAGTPSAPISSEISAAADEAAELTTSTTAVAENQELAVKPTSSSNGRSSRPMPGLLALVGLFVFGAVAFGHKFQRKPKP